MLIDWFTVLAQAINFFILVWLMKRFLYKPILHAIDLREKKIASELADADKKKTEAQKESDEFKSKNTEFDQQRATLLSKATNDVQIEREHLLAEAKKAAADLSAKLQENLKNENQNLQHAISKRTLQEIFAISRKALTDLAGASLEERMVEVFIKQLHDSGLKLSSGPAIIRTTFSLPQAQHESVEKAIKELLGADTKIQFETAPDLISGIELTVNGQKVAWSISDYLSSLNKGVDELLKEKELPIHGK